MPFQFNHLLTSNAPPDDSDALQMEAICTACKQELAAIDSTESEMAVLKAALTDQRKARMDVEERLAKYKALLSPLRRLPIELLQRIFVLCRNPFPKMHADEMPLVLGRICSSWRRISFDTPALWTSVHISLPRLIHPFENERHRSLCRTICGALTQWIDRSGMLPLDISFLADDHEDGSLPPYDPIFLVILIDTLVSYSHRWQQVLLGVPPRLLQRLSGLRAADVPLLSTFQLYGDGYYPHSTAHGLPYIPFVSGAPSLRNLLIASPETSMGWGQLTSLCFQMCGPAVTSDDVLSILRQSPLLQRCTVKSHHSTITPGLPAPVLPVQPEERIGVVHLEYFCIEGDASGSAFSVNYILDCLVTPKLRVLSVHATYPLYQSVHDLDETSSTVMWVREMISRSSCLLQRLYLLCTECSPDIQSQVLSCLRMSPNLTHLILDDRPERNRFSTSAVLGEDVLRALTGASNSTYDTDGPLCPLLQRIGFCDRYACETGLILDFLQSRFYPAAGTQIASLNHASIYSLRPYVLIDSALQAFNEKETPTPTLKDLECALGLKAIERPVSLLACNTVTERNDKVYVFYPTAKTFARSPLNQFEIDEYFAVEPNEHNEFPYSMSF